MSPEQAIVDRLLDISAVTALVGQRVYQLILPQRPTLPAIRVQLIGEGTGAHMRGGTGQYQALVQVDAFTQRTSGGSPFADAIAVAEAVHGDDAGSGLSGWTGSAGGSPPQLLIHAVFRTNRMDSYTHDELQLVRVQQDYLVHWTNA